MIFILQGHVVAAEFCNPRQYLFPVSNDLRLPPNVAAGNRQHRHNYEQRPQAELIPAAEWG